MDAASRRHYDAWITREQPEEPPCQGCGHALEEHSQEGRKPCRAMFDMPRRWRTGPDRPWQEVAAGDACECQAYSDEIPEPDWDAINDDRKLGLL